MSVTSANDVVEGVEGVEGVDGEDPVHRGQGWFGRDRSVGILAVGLALVVLVAMGFFVRALALRMPTMSGVMPLDVVVEAGAAGPQAPTAPSKEAPSREAPSREAPSTEAPSTEAPSTEAPSTEAPSTGAPSIPIRVLALDSQGVVDIADVAVAGRSFDPAGDQIPRPSSQGAFVVDVRAVDGRTGSVAITEPAPRTASLTLGVSPWTKSLAVATAGAAVLPETGVVHSDRGSKVYLVDGSRETVSVAVVDVHPRENVRLEDGRLLAVDRSPVSARVVSEADGAVTLEVRWRQAGWATVDLWVAGTIREMHTLRHVDVPRGNPSSPDADITRLPFPIKDMAPGTLVAATVRASRLPSSPSFVVYGRAGGWTTADLALVWATVLRPTSSRLEGFPSGSLPSSLSSLASSSALLGSLASSLVAHPGLGEALGRRLVVEGVVGAVVVSPTPRAQAEHASQRRAQWAAKARGDYRKAALVSLLLLVVGAVIARARPAAALASVVVVACLWWGLDALLGATGPEAVSSSADAEGRAVTSSTISESL